MCPVKCCVNRLKNYKNIASNTPESLQQMQTAETGVKSYLPVSVPDSIHGLRVVVIPPPPAPYLLPWQQVHSCISPVSSSGTCPSCPVHCSTRWGRIQGIKETKLLGSDSDRSMGEGKTEQGSKTRNSFPASHRQVDVCPCPGKQGSIPGNGDLETQTPSLPASSPSCFSPLFQTDASST